MRVATLLSLFSLCALLLVAGCPGDPPDTAWDAAGAGTDAAVAADASAASPEDTLARCQNSIDDDGDGYTDCADQDCWIFVACLQADAGIVPDAANASADTGTVVFDAGPVAADAGPTATGLSAKTLALVCPHYSIAGFEKFGLEMECKVYGASATGQFVPGSRVTLMREAGGVPTQAAFVRDSTRGGAATFTYRTQCPLPVDVPPMGEAANDPGMPCAFYNQCKAVPGTEARTCNPRDGWGTLVAFAPGEEAYQDTNVNQRHDPGEPFDDLPEPFVDANDNGLHDAEEEFYDGNGNGVWDDKNGTWDAETTIWSYVRVTWTGAPAELVILPGNNSGPGSGGATAHCTSIHYLGRLKDPNGNPPTAANGPSDKVLATCSGNCQVTKVEPYSDLNGLVDVTVGDLHGCLQACTAPACVPTPFSVGFAISRTLDAKGTQTQQTSLDSVVGIDPAPRTGIFQ
ncbi:MAG: hypothetical protein QM765_10580 [Myxococcales bacterium]